MEIDRRCKRSRGPLPARLLEWVRRGGTGAGTAGV